MSSENTSPISNKQETTRNNGFSQSNLVSYLDFLDKTYICMLFVSCKLIPQKITPASINLSTAKLKTRRDGTRF